MDIGGHRFFSKGERVNAPKNVYDVATALPYRDFMTVGLLVDKLKVKNKTKKKRLEISCPIVGFTYNIAP